MPFHQNISKSIISGSGRRTTISADSRDQYPLIDLLMTSSSCLEAVHVVGGGQEGGGQAGRSDKNSGDNINNGQLLFFSWEPAL